MPKVLRKNRAGISLTKFMGNTTHQIINLIPPMDFLI